MDLFIFPLIHPVTHQDPDEWHYWYDGAYP